MRSHDLIRLLDELWHRRKRELEERSPRQSAELSLRPRWWHRPDQGRGRVEWHDVQISVLGNVPLHDFEERLRAASVYETQNGFIGGFPTFHHADYGNGIVCGTVLLNSNGAEWRDVPISELGNPALGTTLSIDSVARRITQVGMVLSEGFLIFSMVRRIR